MKLGLGISSTSVRKAGPPTPAITLSSDSTAEDSVAGSAIGTLAVINATGTPTFSLVDSAGSRAALSGANLQRGATALDYETATFFDVVIGVSGVTPTIANRTIRISVTNVSEGGGFDFAEMGFPSASTTGVRDGVSLTMAPAGDYVVWSGNGGDGAVVTGLEIHGQLRVESANVTIRDCKIVYNAGITAVNIPDIGTNTGCTIEYCDIVGAINGIAGTGTFRYNDLSENDNGINVYGPSLIEHNYIHDFADNAGSGDAHFDGIEINGGGGTTIRHNTIVLNAAQTSAVMINNEFSPVIGILVEDNYLSGGGYTVYTDNGKNPANALEDVTFINNVMGSGFFGFGALYTADVDWIDNVDVVTEKYVDEGSALGTQTSIVPPVTTGEITNTAYGSRASTTCAIPSDAEIGDVVLVFAANGAGAEINLVSLTAAGWTEYTGTLLATVSAGGFYVRPRLFFREIDGTEDPTVTFAQPTINNSVMAMLTLKGAHPTAPIGALTQNNGTGVTATYSALARSTGAAVVAWQINWGDNATVLSAPSGMPTLTKRLQATLHTISTANGGIASTTGVTRTQGTNSSSSNPWIGITFEILPAS